MSAKGTFKTAGEARTYAAINGIDFDNQDDYCDVCEAFHVGLDHDAAVPEQCGSLSLQGFNTVLECKRAPHDDDLHDNGVSSWLEGA
jgi:hypothetical protein